LPSLHVHIPSQTASMAVVQLFRLGHPLLRMTAYYQTAIASLVSPRLDCGPSAACIATSKARLRLCPLFVPVWTSHLLIGASDVCASWQRGSAVSSSWQDLQFTLHEHHQRWSHLRQSKHGRTTIDQRAFAIIFASLNLTSIAQCVVDSKLRTTITTRRLG